MAEYIKRTQWNNRDELKNMFADKPECIEGKMVQCTIATGSLTKGKQYRVRGHFCYLNSYGEKGKKFMMWDQFITIKNDDGYTIKVNRYKFWLVPTDPMEVLKQAQHG